MVLVRRVRLVLQGWHRDGLGRERGEFGLMLSLEFGFLLYIISFLRCISQHTNIERADFADR
jgi:hypothetical protein